MEPHSHSLQASERRRALRRVVVVFKTHFDLGFTDLPDKVMSLYSGPMFEAVMHTMRATAGQPRHMRYNWTLPAWPMKHFLHDPASPETTRREARKLVEAGQLSWHAWPFTTHTSFCGLEDLVRGLHISRGLSEEFGRWPVGAKQTDVPGHTWAFPSLLVRAGVKFLHLGCNPGSHPPHVPRIFWWEGPDGLRLLTYYSVGGYGTSLLPPDEWNLDTWLAVQQTVDNTGPHSPEQLSVMRARLEEEAPGVELVFGELGDFAESLLEHPEQLEGLPVVACDLADSWIHGVGTMPREVARVRELRGRLFNVEAAAALLGWPEAAGDGDFALARQVAPQIDAAYEQLLLFGEHTWGLDVKSTIKRAFGEQFEPARQTEPYRRLEASWRAKAAYVDRAEEALAGAEERVNMELKARNMAHISARSSNEAHFEASRANAIENSRFRVVVDPASGGITSLLDKRMGRDWAARSTEEPFACYRYDLYSAADIAEFMRAYGLFFQDWFVQDFGKAGYPEDSVHLTAYARDFERVEQQITGDGAVLRMVGGTLSPALVETMEAPEQSISIEVALPNDGPYLDLTYTIQRKRATHFAESAVVPLPLNLHNPTYRLGQVGSVIDPARQIAAGANRQLWCVDGWLDASDDRVGLGLLPVDMPLVSIGDVGIFTFDPHRVPSGSTVYSHLFNTQWGTNFPQWQEGDFRFRIRLVPHTGDWRTARLWNTALDTQRPDLPLSGEKGNPVGHSDGLVLTSLRPRYDGSGLVVRFWDALGLHREAVVMMDGPVSAVWRCDLMEHPVEQLQIVPIEGGLFVALPIAPHAVETLLVEFQEEKRDESGDTGRAYD